MKVEKNIPIPSSPTKIIKSMEIGDSLFDEGKDAKTSMIYQCARNAKSRHGMRFIGKAVPGGFRIWRVE